MTSRPTVPNAVKIATRRLSREILQDPPSKLSFAVICEAIKDLFERDGPTRRDAASFFSDGRLEVFASSCGLNPDYCRKLLVKVGLLLASEVDPDTFRAELFLENLAACGVVSQAARVAGISRMKLYRRAHRDRDFALRWEKAEFGWRRVSNRARAIRAADCEAAAS